MVEMTPPRLSTADPPKGSAQSPDLERVSADDLMSLISNGAAPPMIGAVLLLGHCADLDPAQLIAVIGKRLPAVPRLRQRLMKVPFGYGRPIWVDDPAFRIADHLSVMRCPAPGGRQAVLEAASRLLATRLPGDRALWAATIVTDVGEGQAALIFAVHHVLADGAAGLAVLGELVDGGLEVPGRPFPRPAPSRLQLLAGAAQDRLHSIWELPAVLVRLVQAVIRFRPALSQRVEASSLNQPTGPLRHFATVSGDLASVQAVAHAHGATVNDVVLSAITGALHHLLAQRQEVVNTFTISVPVSFRGPADTPELGNRSAVIPLRLPGTGEPLGRLKAVARMTRAAKQAPPGASNTLLGPAFRLLARLGLYKRFIDHQHLIHTFTTNLRGPDHRLCLGGYPVVDLVALTVTSGNVTVSFAALSYAGKLTVTVIADPQTCPDLERLQHLLGAELAELTGQP